MELDILMVIAEIAVALAGFASMVPLIMSQIRVDEEAGNDTVWMVSSACYVFFATSYLVVSLLLSRGRGTGARAVDRVFLLTFLWRSVRKSTISISVPKGGFTCWRSCSA